MNQNPEQIACDQIDSLLGSTKCMVQSKKAINLAAATGVAITVDVITTSTDIRPLVALIRRVCGLDAALTPSDKTVDKNFQEWIFKKQAGALKYTEEQVALLRMIKDYISASFGVDRDDFELGPFNKQGGLGKMWQLFGAETDNYK